MYAIDQNSFSPLVGEKGLEAMATGAVRMGVNQTGLPISTDAIESLFGLGKRHGTGEIKDANRIALRQPALCGRLTEEDARCVLEVSVRQQKEIQGQVSSLIKQRREVLPNPGTLETLANYPQQKNIEMIPRSKTWSKNAAKLCELWSSGKGDGPPWPEDPIETVAAYPPDSAG